jgi:hypothetical protein
MSSKRKQKDEYPLVPFSDSNGSGWFMKPGTKEENITSYNAVLLKDHDDEAITFRVDDRVSIYISDKRCFAQIISLDHDHDDDSYKAEIYWYYSYDDFMAVNEDGITVLPNAKHELDKIGFTREDYALSDHRDYIDITLLHEVVNSEILHTPFTYHTNEDVVTSDNHALSQDPVDHFKAFLMSYRPLLWKTPFGFMFYNRYIKPYLTFGQQPLEQRTMDLLDGCIPRESSFYTRPIDNQLFATRLPEPIQGVCQLCKTTKSLTLNLKRFITMGDSEFHVGQSCYLRLQYVHQLFMMIAQAKQRVRDIQFPDETWYVAMHKRIMTRAQEAERTLK